jgi:apolipoprotein N-acyltransferase
MLSMGVYFCIVQQSANARQAFQLGAIFSTMWLCATYWWLYVSLHYYGGLNGALSVVSVLALSAALSLYYAVAAALTFRLQKKAGSFSALVFAATWVAAEMARGTWLTGFGWGAVGYAHIGGPFAALLPWLGVYGLTAVVVWVSAWIMSFRWNIRPQTLVPLGLIVLGTLGLQFVPPWSTAAGSITATLLQGNIDQNQKFDSQAGVPKALAWYQAELIHAATDLVVTPETAIPVLPVQLPEDYWGTLLRKYQRGDQAALIGVPLGHAQLGYTNSVVGLGGVSEPVWQYDKHHLVPFGEFIPPLFKWFTQMMNIPLGDFNRGDVAQPAFVVHGQRLGVNICYEDLFGEELGARFVDNNKAPTVFVNVSNLGWFGDTVALDQHLNISKARALEFERPFLRATNTGTTSIIDHQGNVTASIPRLTQSVLEGVVEGRSGITPFAWWVSRFGLWPLWIGVCLVVGWAALRRHGASTAAVPT